MPLRPVRAALAALILAACATPRAEPPGPAPTRPPPERPRPAPDQPPEPPRPAERIELSALPGWSRDDHLAAFEAYKRTCHLVADQALRAICAKARTITPTSGQDARAFFEAHFQAEPSAPPGVLTAYFAPVYPARRRPDAEFSAPVRPKPADLRALDGGAVARARPDGSLEAYPDRAAIEAQPADDALAWMRPEELFFLQVQGSGVLVFEDGRRMKALYAAHNGRPFSGIANPMRDRGILGRDETSGEAIRAWLAANRGPAADEIMRINPRYVFFTLAADDGRPPVGAAGVPLPAGRAIAVDRSFHRLGELFWLDAEAPLLAGAFPAYRLLAMSLDVGGAIRGEARADLYLGEGPAAGTEAGRVRHTLRLHRLVPRR